MISCAAIFHELLKGAREFAVCHWSYWFAVVGLQLGVSHDRLRVLQMGPIGLMGLMWFTRSNAGPQNAIQHTEDSDSTELAESCPT